MRPLLLLAALTIASTALAAELSLETLAKVQHEQAKALDRVTEKYGRRPSSELSTSERRGMIREQQRALSDVQSALGVSQKDVARTLATLTPPERKALAEKIAELEAKEQAAAEQQTQPPSAPPVELYEGLDEGQLEQLDAPPPPEGQVQIMLPGTGTADTGAPQTE